MVYSCLVDADFLDTEQFMADGYTAREPEGISEKHLEKLMGYVGGWMENTDRTTAVSYTHLTIIDLAVQRGITDLAITDHFDPFDEALSNRDKGLEALL